MVTPTITLLSTIYRSNINRLGLGDMYYIIILQTTTYNDSIEKAGLLT